MNYTDVRHRFHTLAEPSGHEDKTAAEIFHLLSLFNPTQIIKIPGSHSLLAEYKFSDEGRTLLFRGDMDAVTVNETASFSYISQTYGVSHKCGHDGHTTILLGLAEQLFLHPLKKGTVLLFFQAEEETGKGAQNLLDSGVLSRYAIDNVFALHSIPGVQPLTILCKKGSFTCSVISCEIMLYGKTAHAAEPQNGISPFAAASQIVQKMLSWNQPIIEKRNYQIITLIELHLGEKAYGVAAGNGVLRFTLRAKTDTLLHTLIQKSEMMIQHVVSQTAGLHHDIQWLEYFAACKNHPDAIKIIKNSCSLLKLTYHENKNPYSWGEDFGLLTQHYKGALFGLGNGTNCAPLHHPDYNFNDDVIEKAVQLFYQICLA